MEHERVLNLTSQLATNAHVVAAFEQSLANMTARLQHLTSTAEKKDHELNELRRSIELYKQVRFNFHVILSIILGVILENQIQTSVSEILNVGPTSEVKRFRIVFMEIPGSQNL